MKLDKKLIKRIKLTQNKFAIVDEEDFDKLNKWKWHAHKDNKNGVFYVWRNSHISEGIKKQRTFLMHREIMNAPKGMVVDHINHDGLDNRKCNLRLCTCSQNSANQTKKGLKGAHKDKRYSRWISSTKYKQKTIYIGSFRTQIEAAKAYDKKVIELFGEFANPNFK